VSPDPVKDPAPAGENPLPNSYWVVPGKVLAGEHPCGRTPEETLERVEKLLAAGVRGFIDLTLPDELESYDGELPMDVIYLRKPIRDHSIPARPEHMADILGCIDHFLRSGRLVYVHCRAGIGRTGTVMGCLLVEQGLDGSRALDELNQLWLKCKRSGNWPSIPETDDQIDYVNRWKRGLLKAVLGGATPDKTAAADPLLDPETLYAARNLRDRFLGSLIGLAVGDALAAATQYRKPGTFTPIGDLIGGGPFEMPRGAWTDDTAMALCLAESLLEKDGFDPRDQTDRFMQWRQRGHLSSTGQCVGITAGTVKALSMAQWRRQVFSGSHDPNQLDPEVLSRVAPAVAFYFATPPEAIQLASDAARTTCQAPEAVDACRLLGAMIYSALAGRPKEQVVRPTPDLIDVAALRPNVAAIMQRSTLGGGLTQMSAGETTPEVLDAAIWALRTTSSFRDGALRAANLGGNCDVVAAVYGALAGAHYGVASIPAAWRNSLTAKDLIEGFADRLLAHAMLGLGA
jgi:ADP-ribosylglycohydrolase/protein-tyrosine phosphatase